MRQYASEPQATSHQMAPKRHSWMFPAIQTRKSAHAVGEVTYASAISTATTTTATRQTYQGLAPMNLLQTLRVRVRPVRIIIPLTFQVYLLTSCSLAVSFDYTQDVTFCPDGSYCCGQDNTTCCNTNSARLEIFYGNPGEIPTGSASLSGYYSSLRLSTKGRSATISASSSFSTQNPSATLSNSQTAFTLSSTQMSSTTFSHSQAAFTSSSTQNPRNTSSNSQTASTISSATSIISPTSSPQSVDGAGSLNQDGKIAIGVAIPIVALLVAAFVAEAQAILRRRRLSKAMVTTETNERNLAGSDVPDQPSVGELSTGLDRAELPTKHWDATELPATRAHAELGTHSSIHDVPNRMQ